MILIISTNKEEIGYFEFVLPIENIVKEYKEYEIKKYKEIKDIDLNKYEKIIVTGTNIMDFDYLNYTEYFKRILEKDIETLAICSGSQIFSILLNYKLIDYELIGKYLVKVIKDNFYLNQDFYSYFIITKIPKIDDKFEIYGYVNDIPVFYRYRNIYFTLFHPEVLNKELIEKFIKK